MKSKTCIICDKKTHEIHELIGGSLECKHRNDVDFEAITQQKDKDTFLLKIHLSMKKRVLNMVYSIPSEIIKSMLKNENRDSHDWEWLFAIIEEASLKRFECKCKNLKTRKKKA